MSAHRDPYRPPCSRCRCSIYYKIPYVRNIMFVRVSLARGSYGMLAMSCKRIMYTYSLIVVVLRHGQRLERSWREESVDGTTFAVLLQRRERLFETQFVGQLNTCEQNTVITTTTTIIKTNNTSLFRSMRIAIRVVCIFFFFIIKHVIMPKRYCFRINNLCIAL